LLIRIVLFIGVINIILMSILMKNYWSVSRNLMISTKLLKLKKTEGPTWHSWMKIETKIII